MKVVVIDDDPIVLEVVKGTLEDMGHEATTRSSALGASAWILCERPDMVLLDLGMPVLPGDAWLRMITQQGLETADGYQPAFVVFSSRSVEEIERIVSETCAIGYIHKGGPEAFEAAFAKLADGLGS